MTKAAVSGKSNPQVEDGSPAPLDRNAALNKLKTLAPDIGDAAATKLADYYAELLRFNPTLNLVSAITIHTAINIHFLDSIMAAKVIYKNLLPNEPLYDVGSGNGFPGLVMAILYPQLPVVLVDRDSRKVEFLKHVIAQLQLKNVTTEIVSVEDIAPKKMKNVISRGFAPLNRALLVVRKQVAEKGRFFHLKGDGWANELASVPSQLFSYWSPSLLGQYRIPETSSNMAVVVTEKIAD